jgi:Kef-type K+ transport system membrane component KefB
MITLFIYPILGTLAFALLIKLSHYETKLAGYLKYVCAASCIFTISSFFLSFLYPEVQEHLSNFKASELMPLVYIALLAIFDFYLYKNSFYISYIKSYIMDTFENFGKLKYRILKD